MTEASKSVHPLTSKFLGKELYVVTARPVRSPAITDELLAAHLAHQIDSERRGILFAAGPVYPREGTMPEAGMIVLRASSFEEAEAIAAEDPLHQCGARTFTLQKWRVNEGSFTVTINYSDQSAKVV